MNPRKEAPNLLPSTLRVNLPTSKNINKNKLAVLHPCITDRELLEIFPESKAIIPQKLKEWLEKEREIEEVIKYNLKLIRYRVKDEFSRFFWRAVTKMEVSEALLEIERQIYRLRRLKSISEGKIQRPKTVSKEMIERARQTSILEVASPFLIKLKRTGRNFKALCPFHNEKNPSFYLYLESNRFYCFGCNASGDVIDFIQHLHNCSFKEAIKCLT